MPNNPNCATCGKRATDFKYRPFCSDKCNPEKQKKTPAAKPDTSKDK